MLYVLVLIACGYITDGWTPVPTDSNVPMRTWEKSDLVFRSDAYSLKRYRTGTINNKEILNTVVRVTNQNGGQYDIGTGCIIYSENGYAYVLTCRHLFSSGVGSVSVETTTGKANAYLLATDNLHDLALVEFGYIFNGENKTYPYLIVNDNEPNISEICTLYGFDQGDILYEKTGTVIRTGIYDGGTEVVIVSPTAISGNSGGPIVNGRSELIAVCVAGGGRNCVGVRNGPIRRFLSKLSGHRKFKYINSANAADCIGCVRPPINSKENFPQEMPQSPRRGPHVGPVVDLPPTTGPRGPTAPNLNPTTPMNPQVSIGPAGPVGPAGPRGPPGESVDLKPLELKVQDLNTKYSTMNTTLTITKSNLDEIIKQIKNLQLESQDNKILFQRVNQRVDSVEKRLTGSLKFKMQYDPKTNQLQIVE